MTQANPGNSGAAHLGHALFSNPLGLCGRLLGARFGIDIMNDLAALQQTSPGSGKRERRRWHWLLLLALVLCITLVLDIATGPSLLALHDVIDALVSPPRPIP